MKRLSSLAWKRTRWPLVGILVLTVTAVPVLAVLGVGDVVYDPTNFAEAVKELTQLEQEYAELVDTYHMVQNQYQQMLWMAQEVPVLMAMRYRAVSTPWTFAAAQDVYANTGPWLTGINSGLNSAGGYAAATRALGSYGAGLDTLSSGQRANLETDYATVELADGANVAAIQTIGQMRGNALAVEAAIQNLESDSLSADPSMNTEIAVLNKMNAADVIALRNQQDANKLLVALAEAQVIASKRERDAEARAFNDHIQFVAQGQTAMAAQAAGASDAMLAWRMP